MWETVIGLEVHIELSTQSKIFCTCSTAFGAEPNTQCCPVCMGLPGSLPVLNKEVKRSAVMMALALQCHVSSVSTFDRKNYFYPDLPKAYQISQLYSPIGKDGEVTFCVDGERKKARIHEMHMEEDAGKLVHSAYAGETYPDYNRCGVPLLEIVSEPDFRSAEEVVAYLEKLRVICLGLGISDCKMQEGSMRVDVNLSLREKGTDQLGTRTETKNINSFRAIEHAIRFETERQKELLERGERVVQQTRHWDEEKQRSTAMRGKENAQDYRYFPDPDLPPVVTDEEEIRTLSALLPEFADAKKERFIREYGLTAQETDRVVVSPNIADLFEKTVKLGIAPEDVAHWIGDPLLKIANEKELHHAHLRLSAEDFAEVIRLVKDGKIIRSSGIRLLEAVTDGEKDIAGYVERNNLAVERDGNLVEETVAKVFADYPNVVADYKKGKTQAVGFLIGQAMRLLKGKADPATVQKAITERLKNG